MTINDIEMKKIKDLTIKVTYRVGLSDVEVPDKVYDELGMHLFPNNLPQRSLYASRAFFFSSLQPSAYANRHIRYSCS